jgi:hypothetical protein
MTSVHRLRELVTAICGASGVFGKQKTQAIAAFLGEPAIPK